MTDRAADRCFERNDGQPTCSTPRHPNTTRREHIAQQRKAAHANDHREHPRHISTPASHWHPANAVEARTPVLRVCPGRLVARSTELTSELPSLLAALSLRVGSIDSVLYHESDWSPAPLSIKHQGDQVIVSAHQEWPNVVSVVGPRFGRLDLLVVPPYTEPTHAYNVVMTAASVNDASTPDQLLGITHRADDRVLSPIALERWEADGGALPLPSRSQRQMQDA